MFSGTYKFYEKITNQFRENERLKRDRVENSSNLDLSLIFTPYR